MAYRSHKFSIKTNLFFSTGFLTQIQALEYEQCSICYLLTLSFILFMHNGLGTYFIFGIRSSSPFSRHFAHA